MKEKLFVPSKPKIRELFLPEDKDHQALLDQKRVEYYLRRGSYIREKYGSFVYVPLEQLIGKESAQAEYATRLITELFDNGVVIVIQFYFDQAALRVGKKVHIPFFDKLQAAVKLLDLYTNPEWGMKLLDQTSDGSKIIKVRYK